MEDVESDHNIADNFRLPSARVKDTASSPDHELTSAYSTYPQVAHDTFPIMVGHAYASTVAARLMQHGRERIAANLKRFALQLMGHCARYS